MKNSHFAQQLIAWYQNHGRHDLPWQKTMTPYRVWVSEIMLQQTQVTTVIDYYQRFMKRFPSLKSLATAPLDEVLLFWSGLGYYARARNLHKTAQIIQQEQNGRFPSTVEALSKLPGIGKSTAGAILSFSKKEFAVILDGNVKRVLTRFFAFEEPIDKTASIKLLWERATNLTPKDQAHHYNQAIMDLGATICTRTKPKCNSCPFIKSCRAYQNNQVLAYPKKTQKKSRPIKQIRMLIIQNKRQEILLLKRPEKGIWGGLWSFPECNVDHDHTNWPLQGGFFSAIETKTLAAFKHQFTHFVLEIHPTLLSVDEQISIDSQESIWYTLSSSLPGGIAAPVAKLLEQLRE